MEFEKVGQFCQTCPAYPLVVLDRFEFKGLGKPTSLVMADRSLKDMDNERPWQFMKYFLTGKNRLFKYQEGSKEQLSGYEAVEVTDVYGGKYAMLEKYERAGMPWNPSGMLMGASRGFLKHNDLG